MKNPLSHQQRGRLVFESSPPITPESFYILICFQGIFIASPRVQRTRSRVSAVCRECAHRCFFTLHYISPRVYRLLREKRDSLDVSHIAERVMVYL